MTVYLLNSPVLTAYGCYQFSPISDEQARELASGSVHSAVGHEGAAAFLSVVLARQVDWQRERICMMPGDKAVVLRLLDRLPEGAVLDAEELKRLPYEMSLLECLA